MYCAKHVHAYLLNSLQKALLYSQNVLQKTVGFLFAGKKDPPVAEGPALFLVSIHLKVYFD